MNDHLHWRYTTKKFDPSQKVSEKEFCSLLDVLRLSPSSYGLQPWKFVTVSQPEMRARLKEYAWGQPQVVDASHLIVCCARTAIDDAYIRRHMEQISKMRRVGLESLTKYEQSIRNFVRSQTQQELENWIKRQLYIPLGMLLDECAHRKIDACAMEGFDEKKVDAALDLEDQGVTSVVFCGVGYRAADDIYAGLERVRFESKDIFIER